MFPWPTGRDLGWGRASSSKGEVSIILPQTTSCAPEPCLLQPGLLPPLTSAPLPFTRSQFVLHSHACIHNTLTAFVNTKERGRCWAWGGPDAAAHPLQNWSSVLALSVRTAAGAKKSKQSSVRHQANIPWEACASHNLMDCFYSVSCHKTHFLGGMFPSFSSS